MSRPKKLVTLAEKAIQKWAPKLLLADYSFRVEDHLSKAHDDVGTLATCEADRVQKLCNVGLWKGLTVRGLEGVILHELIHAVLMDLGTPLEPNAEPCEALCNRLAEIFVRLETDGTIK